MINFGFVFVITPSYNICYKTVDSNKAIIINVCKILDFNLCLAHVYHTTKKIFVVSIDSHILTRDQLVLLAKIAGSTEHG